MFGEYIPFRGELGWLIGMTNAAGTNLVPGSGLTVFEAADVNIGPLICFESALPDMSRAEADHTPYDRHGNHVPMMVCAGLTVLTMPTAIRLRLPVNPTE